MNRICFTDRDAGISFATYGRYAFRRRYDRVCGGDSVLAQARREQVQNR